jgi:hypothetical protein
MYISLTRSHTLSLTGTWCDQKLLDTYYSDVSSTPSHSPFLNSGILMGKIPDIIEMLQHVIVNNGTYHIRKNADVTKFDDQLAYTAYAFQVKPDTVALDYHQQLMASFSLHAPGDPHEDGWPFTCRSNDNDKRWKNNICPSCPNWTQLLSKHGYFKLNEKTCQIIRTNWNDMPLVRELATLAPGK